MSGLFRRSRLASLLLLLTLPGATAFAGAGTWIAVQKFEPSMGDYEFIAHVREQFGLDTAEVNIPRITSDATTQPVIQARVVYTTGINTPVNSPGTVHTNWTDVGTMNAQGILDGATILVRETLWDPVQLQVRIKNTSITATMPQQKFHAGTSIVLDGQSDVQASFRFGDTDNIAPPALIRNGNVQFIFFHRDNNGTPIILDPLTRWTLTSTTDRQWRTAAGVMVANMLHQLKPGRQFLITVPAMNGMGLGAQLLHNSDNRLWEHEQQIAALARLGGFHPGLFHYVVSSNTDLKYCESIGPLLFGKNRDGAEFQPGDTFTWTELHWVASETFSHLYTELWDRTKMKMLISCPWTSNVADLERQRKSELIRKHMIEKPAYQQYLSGTGWSYNFVSFWRGWDINDDSHASRNHYEGAARSAMQMVHAVLGEGNVTAPVIARMIDAKWNPLGQNKYVILGTDYGPVTTWRRIRGEPRKSGKAEVLGFYIDGVAATRATIRDINGNLADQGYIWLEKNNGATWTGNEVITRAPSFTWNYPTPSNTHNETNSDIMIDRGYDGTIMDWPGVASGPSDFVPLGIYGDAPNWAEYDTGPLESANNAPSAVASATPSSGTAPLTVSLNGSGSSDSDGSIVSYNWSSNGSTVATGQTASITLQQGIHVVVLTVTDNDGATDTDSVSINVSAPSGGGGADITEVITASGEDVQIDQNGSAAFVGKNNARVGNGGSSTLRTVLVMPFQLPALPAGYSVESATLSLNLEAWNNWSGQLSGADLYGIGVVSTSPTPNAAATYVNGANPSSNPDAYLISDNLLTSSLINTSSGSGQTIPVTSANFASFIQALYNGGATEGDYAFLTLAHDNVLTLQRYFEVTTSDSTTRPKPVLTLVLAASSGGPPQTVVIDVATTDVGVDANLAQRWVGENHVRVGNSYSTTVRSVMVIPFELPALPAGHSVQSATLDLNLQGWSNWGGGLSNIDLYGISVVSSSATPSAGTVYVNGVSPGSNQNAQLLQNNLLVPSMINTTSGSNQTIPVTSASFATFVQSLYNGGAQPGQFAFLTLAHDGAITSQLYYDLTSADGTGFPTPVITIVSGD